MKKLISVAMAFALCVVAFAQSGIKVVAPNVVGLDEQFNISFVIEGDKPSDFSWNPGDDFQLVWGPQKGSSTSVSIINGKRTSSSQTTYSYILSPKKTGKFQIAAAEATVKGDKITSSPATIEVVGNGASKPSGNQGHTSGNSQSQQSQGGGSNISGEDMFLRLSFSKRSVMVGEPVTATLKLYQRVNIAGFEDAKFPDFNGFWSQELQAPQSIEFHRETLDDKIYNAATLRSWSLIPQKAGDISVGGAELVCLVNVRNPRASTGSIFDSFFQDDYQTVRKKVSTSPVTIHVSALPAGAPASFGGGVGTFKMSSALSRNEMKAHDAASLTVTVTGSGNVSLLEAPKISFPPDFEVYDVKTSDIQGGKVFEYPFIPRSHGDFTLGPVEYSYFDINSRKYVTLTGESLPVHVERGSADASSGNAGQLVQGTVRKDVRDLGSDIRYMAKDSRLSKLGSFFVGSAAFWILLALLVAAAVAAYAALKTVAARRADVAGSRNRAASKMARKRLAQAGEFLGKDLYTAFYEELHRALLGFASDKLTMDAAEMSKDNISSRLKDGGVPETVADDFIGLIDACEFARYAPDTGHEAMNSHFEKAVETISSIDSSMKKSHRNPGAVAAILALLMLAPAGARAADNAYADSLWTVGIRAYENGEWTVAAQSWDSIRSMGLESAELYYNIGNACFKADDIAHAIVNYERALKLDPSYSDARFNLEFAQSMVQDKIESVPQFFLKTWLKKACWMLSSNAWAILFLLLFAAALALALLFVLGGSVASRRSGFIGGIVALVLSVFCLGFAFWQKADYRKADGAVVIRAVTTVKSSPDNGSAKDLFVLHEGTEVKLLDSVGAWFNIELADGRQGWMASADLEVI